MIIADTHVHFYPCYDTGTAFDHLSGNLQKLNRSATRAAFLTERKECCFFSDLKDGRIPLPESFTVENTNEDNAVRIIKNGELSFYLFAGRQIATAERLEILSLTGSTIIEDGQPAHDTIRQVNDEGAVAVLTWALGKWTGGRKKTVSDLLRAHSPEKLLAGDSSMRPSCLPQPAILSKALSEGTSVIAGSDPLPFKGDEQYMGTYATIIDGEIDSNTPVSSARKLLKSGSANISRAGSRCGLISVITRQMKL